MPRVVTPKPAPPVRPRLQLGKKVQAHQRYYLDDGAMVPGVTTIVGQLHKAALVPWANKLGLQGIDTSKYVDEAALVGTLAHHLIESALKDEKPELGDYSQNQIDLAMESAAAWQRWLTGHQLEPILVEHPMVSEKFRYGGTIDLYAVLDGTPMLLDFKTSGAIYREHKIQTAAYWKLLEENGHPVKGVRLIRIGRDGGSLEEHQVSGREVIAGWRTFRALRAVYDGLKELEGQPLSETAARRARTWVS